MIKAGIHKGNTFIIDHSLIVKAENIVIAYKAYEAYLVSMRSKIMQWTNIIPLSIGVAPTKTLSKLANHKNNMIKASKQNLLK